MPVPLLGLRRTPTPTAVDSPPAAAVSACSSRKSVPPLGLSTMLVHSPRAPGGSYETYSSSEEEDDLPRMPAPPPPPPPPPPPAAPVPTPSAAPAVLENAAVPPGIRPRPMLGRFQ
jgi:hypothetical protein